MSLHMEQMHFVSALDPVADALLGIVNSDIISLRDFGGAMFIIHAGVGTTGTSTITIESYDDVSGTNPNAIPFYYRANTTTDTHGAITLATTAGFTTTAGSSDLYIIEIRAEDLDPSQHFVGLHAVEVVSNPVLAGILAIGLDPSYPQAVSNTMIV